MATATRKTRTTAAKTSKPATTRKATGKGKTTAAKPAAADGPSKRELQAAQNDKLRVKVVNLRGAEQSWAEIATELGVTPGKAQFLMMEHLVAEGEVPAITHRNEAELVKKIAAARAKADEHSSWGWLAARASVPHTRLQALMKEQGLYETGTENIAAIRAEKNGGGTKKGNAPTKGKPAATARKTGKAATTAAKKGVTASAKATAARKRAAAKAGKAKTS